MKKEQFKIMVTLGEWIFFFGGYIHGQTVKKKFETYGNTFNF